jgi:hypothetical protein
MTTPDAVTWAKELEKIVAHFFLWVWIDRGRMPDKAAADYLIEKFTTLHTQAVRAERDRVIGAAEVWVNVAASRQSLSDFLRAQDQRP